MAQLSSSLFLGVMTPIGVRVAVATPVPPRVGVVVGVPPVTAGVGVGVGPDGAVFVGVPPPPVPTVIAPSVQDAAIGPPAGSLAPEFEQVSG